nr:hypothetical protein [Tanacetum cinerariifolium]
ENPPPEVSMADNRTMAELLQFFGHDKEDPYAHIRRCQDRYELIHPAISSDFDELKDMVKALLLDKKNQSPAPTPSTTPAPVKAVEPNCVTCGGAHSYQNCPATHENAYRDNIQEYVSQAAAASYNQENTGFRPQMQAADDVVAENVHADDVVDVVADDVIVDDVADVVAHAAAEPTSPSPTPTTTPPPPSQELPSTS